MRGTKHVFAGIAATRQVLSRCIGTATAARTDTELPLQGAHGVSPLGDSFLNLAFSDGITDTNKHENNYQPILYVMQLSICNFCRYFSSRNPLF